MADMLPTGIQCTALPVISKQFLAITAVFVYCMFRTFLLANLFVLRLVCSVFASHECGVVMSLITSGRLSVCLSVCPRKFFSDVQLNPQNM